MGHTDQANHAMDNQPEVIHTLNPAGLVGKNAFDKLPLKITHIRTRHKLAPPCRINKVNHNQLIL